MIKKYLIIIMKKSLMNLMKWILYQKIQLEQDVMNQD